VTAARLILASSSPRRRELLRAAGVTFEVAAAGLDEESLHLDVLSPSGRAVALARAKARAVARAHPGAWVLGADTIVVLDGEQLAKPADADEALWMLSRLAGRPHEVLTGLALLGGAEGAEHTTFEATTVRFHRWPAAALLSYARSADPLDKAGGYGIQGPAGAFVERVDGCYFNVVGLPLGRVRRLLGLAGLA
jgi:septum formation protein